jgi:hypothetical protein
MDTLINYKGYGILKSTLSSTQTKKIKEDLNVKPNVLPNYDFGDNKPFPVYRHNSQRFYLPKFYGISEFGKPTNITEREGTDIDHNFVLNLRPYQIEFSEKLLKKLNEDDSCIGCSGTGSGKCLALNTPIIMYNGSIKMVQDITVGDLLMGEDSKPRTVLSLGRGEDTMYEIIPTKGETYTFNSEHILSLKCTRLGVTKVKSGRWTSCYFNNKTIRVNSKTFDTEKEANDFLNSLTEESKVVNIEIKNYLKLSKTTKHKLKLYRVPVNFPERPVPFDP